MRSHRSGENTLHWGHNNHDGVSNHQPHGCLLTCLFRRRSKKTSNLRVTGLCVGISPGPVNSPHKGPVTRKMFPFDDVIMKTTNRVRCCYNAVNFLTKPHTRYPICRPHRRAMGCLLWILRLIFVLLKSLLIAISCYVGPRYNGTWLYILLLFTDIYGDPFITWMITYHNTDVSNPSFLPYWWFPGLWDL